MTEADVAAKLRALALRVRRLLPLNHEPERFHEEKSEVAHDLAALAEEVFPAGGIRSARRDVKQTPVAPRRLVVTTTVINGRRVAVQRQRSPFAIFVEK